MGAQDLGSPRTTVRRLPDRGANDRDAVNAVLDAALVCHLGFSVDGQPYVIPTIHARDGDTVYIHGSVASRMLRTMKQGADVCLTVTIVDGIVLARSMFHHSINYRSAVVLGRATEVTDDATKRHGLEVISDHVLAGRWDEARPPNDKELRATSLLALPITEASAKIRSGPPSDDEEDYALPVWAGVLPIVTVNGAPEPDPRLDPAMPLPPSATRGR